MFSLFAPGYLKEAQLVLKNARKLLHYKKDILSSESRAQFENAIARLQAGIRARDRPGIEQAAQDLDKQWSKFLPPASEAGWRENCEVFLVAIVIAIGVRTYFLQPFTIPTGSMQPTLNGIIGHVTDAPPPNILVRIVEFALRGRTYVNTVAKADDVVVSIPPEHSVLFFFKMTEIRCTQSTYRIWAPEETLIRTWNIRIGREYQPGEPIARGYLDAGDHVFVDKVSYNLRKPARGEVFVFSTRGIPFIQNELNLEGIEGSEFYIKRLVGLPLDTLQVIAPLLYVNGQIANSPGCLRVMSCKDGYRGYSNPENARRLNSPDDIYPVPAGHYFAMGDNSYNSSDSRFWGPVPPENLMGRGLFVYWPFLPHWGFVK